MDKSELRKHFRAVGAQREIKEENLQSLNVRLRGLMDQHPGVWAGYRALPDEVPLAQSSGSMEWALPRVDGERLRFHLGAKMSKGMFGIEEPVADTGKEIPVASLAGVVVPGLAFDRRGYRLGRGQGFYDRLFQNYKGIKVGICWNDQLVDALPTEVQDIPMNWIVTESELMEIKWK